MADQPDYARLHVIGVVMHSHQGAVVPYVWRPTFAEAQTVADQLNAQTRSIGEVFFAVPIGDSLPTERATIVEDI